MIDMMSKNLMLICGLYAIRIREEIPRTAHS
jgi:hypothetical protein